MTLEQLKTKKTELETKVSGLLTEFQNETNAERIDMTFARVAGNKKEQPLKIIVHVEVSL